MAAPVTPDQWLPVLTKRIDDRRPRIETLRSYVNGDAPLPEMSKNVRASWQRFQQKARTNFGELIVEALAERLICHGVTVGGSTEDDDRARRIWVDNRMDIALGDAIRDMLTLSVGYMVVGRGAFGEAVITAERPEFMYAATDPLRPWIARAAVKIWRDIDASTDYALVWADSTRVLYERSMFITPEQARKYKLRTGAQGGWSKVEGSEEFYQGDPPVVIFENHEGTGEFETHTDLIDRINLGLLQRLVTVAMQAFRQRAIRGGLPQTDEGGNPIDYAATFAPAPGALWDLPAGIDIWESQDSSAGIQAMLTSVKDDIRDLSAVTRTPSAVLMPDASNQSAQGAAFAREGLVFKAYDRIARIRPSVNQIMKLALRIESPDFDEVVDTLWAPPEHVSMAEKYQAAVQAKAADVPWRTRMLDILGFPADKVDQMEIERAQEQLTIDTLLASTQPQPTPEIPGLTAAGAEAATSANA
jgi:hypothetical protein